MSDFFFAIREFWREAKAGTALFLITLFVGVYGLIALDYESVQGWKGHESVQNVLKDVSVFIPVGGILVGMLIGGVDLMMLFSDWYFDRQKKRIAAAKAEGRAEGEAAGRAAGEAAGRAEGEAAVYQEIAAWDRRRRAAEARGETFTEPLPAPSAGRSEK